MNKWLYIFLLLPAAFLTLFLSYDIGLSTLFSKETFIAHRSISPTPVTTQPFVFLISLGNFLSYGSLALLMFLSPFNRDNDQKIYSEILSKFYSKLTTFFLYIAVISLFIFPVLFYIYLTYNYFSAR